MKICLLVKYSIPSASDLNLNLDDSRHATKLGCCLGLYHMTYIIGTRSAFTFAATCASKVPFKNSILKTWYRSESAVCVMHLRYSTFHCKLSSRHITDSNFQSSKFLVGFGGYWAFTLDVLFHFDFFLEEFKISYFRREYRLQIRKYFLQVVSWPSRRK